MKNPLDILQQHYGYDAFRDGQADIIEHVNAGGHAFVIMPTGGGKSLCYQIPALCREGIGVVVSPLIALMQDQINALQQIGVRARAINSSMPFDEIREVQHAMRRGELDLLYVAPERLIMPEFLSLLEQCRLALFAIDEAHCVSQWGHDFRPDYAALSLLAQRFAHIPRIALTATADQATRKDILERLQLQDGRTFISGFDRPNIHYSIAPRNNAKQQAWQFIQTYHKEDSGIIYCSSRKRVDDMAAWLQERGVHALAYHAGLPAQQRAQHQEMFLRDDNVVMVATIAFGMGIDKPDVRFVVHMNIPANIEAYYQETGRAGRDGLPSNAFMIFSAEDAVMQRHWIDDSDASDMQKSIQHQKLNALLGLCEAATCRRQILLRYFGDDTPPCHHCDTCERPPETFDATIAAQKALSCVYRTGQTFGVSYLIEVLSGDKTERIVRFGHDKQSTFGIGDDYSKAQWKHIFRQLVTLNLVTTDMTGHHGLRITDTGAKFLKEKESLHMRVYETPSRRALSSGVKSGGRVIVEAQYQPLYERLREVRQSLAREYNVPAYVIFHDKTLAELARAQPQSLGAMLHVHGVGAAKLARYGEALLEVLVAHETA